MTDQTTAINPIQFLKKDDVAKKFQELLGKRASWFLTTVMNVVANNDRLKNADPQSVYLSALVSATLDLPINPNLGFAYIVPYDTKYQDEKWDWQKKQIAQFQMWYKWFIQLAQRSWVFKTIAACPVYEWQLIEENPLTGYIFDWKAKKSETVIWYAWYFSLNNWFEKTLYMTVEELKWHWGKYSASYKYDIKEKKWSSLWSTDFDAMAQKTVIKLLLSKFAPLSVEMQTAVITDQWIIHDESFENVEYADNPPLVESTNNIDPEFLQKREDDLKACTTTDEVNQLMKQNKPTDPTVLSLFQKRHEEIQN